MSQRLEMVMAISGLILALLAVLESITEEKQLMAQYLHPKEATIGRSSFLIHNCWPTRSQFENFSIK